MLLGIAILLTFHNYVSAEETAVEKVEKIPECVDTKNLYVNKATCEKFIQQNLCICLQNNGAKYCCGKCAYRGIKNCGCIDSAIFQVTVRHRIWGRCKHCTCEKLQKFGYDGAKKACKRADVKTHCCQVCKNLKYTVPY